MNMKNVFNGFLLLVVCAAFYSVCLAQQPVKAVPLYRLYGNGEHFYTTSEAELNAFVNMGYAGEGVTGYVFDQPLSGLVPLLRYAGPTDAGLRHFYTISKGKGDGAVQVGFKYEGVSCYVAPKPLDGAVPLYRLYQSQQAPAVTGYFSSAPTGEDHFYTTQETERDGAINDHGYVSEGNEGFIWRKQISFAIPMSPAARAEQYEQMLFNEGCVKNAGNPTQIACSSEIGYFNCEVAKTKNYLKISACLAPASHQAYLQMNQKLVALNCEHFLGRPGQYMCENIKGADACESYMKLANSPITKCISIKGMAISKDLGKRGCEHLLGRSNEYLCKNDDAFNACENYRLDGQVKKCVSTKKTK